MRNMTVRHKKNSHQKSLFLHCPMYSTYFRAHVYFASKLQMSIEGKSRNFRKRLSFMVTVNQENKLVQMLLYVFLIKDVYK